MGRRERRHQEDAPSSAIKQIEIRVKVAPVPFIADAREGYGGGWRLRQTA